MPAFFLLAPTRVGERIEVRGCSLPNSAPVDGRGKPGHGGFLGYSAEKTVTLIGVGLPLLQGLFT